MTKTEEKKRSAAGLLGRGIWVLMAFVLALGVSALLLAVMGSFTMAEELRDGYAPQGELGTLVQLLSLLFGGASFLIVTTPILSVLPALVAVLVGEVIQLRSVLYYIVAGGLSLVALPILGSPNNTPFDTQFLAIFATAGFAGGGFYWLLAGRNA